MISASDSPVLDSSRLFSYSLVNSRLAPSIRESSSVPCIRAICCDGSAAKPKPRSRHSLLCRTMAAGSSALITTRSAPVPVDRRRELDHAGLAHRAGVERPDLAHLLVGRADEAGGVLDRRDVHESQSTPCRVSQTAVVVEVRRRPRRSAPALRRAAPCRSDVGRDAAAADDEVVDEEGQRHLVQLVGEQLLGELARESASGGRWRSNRRRGRARQARYPIAPTDSERRRYPAAPT